MLEGGLGEEACVDDEVLEQTSVNRAWCWKLKLFSRTGYIQLDRGMFSFQLNSPVYNRRPLNAPQKQVSGHRDSGIYIAGLCVY